MWLILVISLVNAFFSTKVVIVFKFWPLAVVFFRLCDELGNRALIVTGWFLSR